MPKTVLNTLHEANKGKHVTTLLPILIKVMKDWAT